MEAAERSKGRSFLQLAVARDGVTAGAFMPVSVPQSLSIIFMVDEMKLLRMRGGCGHCFLTFKRVGVCLSHHRWPVEWRPDSSDVAMAANSISIVFYRVALTASISNEVLIVSTNGEDKEMCRCCRSYGGRFSRRRSTGGPIPKACCASTSFQLSIALMHNLCRYWINFNEITLLIFHTYFIPPLNLSFKVIYATGQAPGVVFRV